MAVQSAAGRRVVRGRVKDMSNGDSSDYECEERPNGGSTCLSILVMATLIGGIAVLFGLMSLQSPVLNDGPPAHELPTAEHARVVVEQSQDGGRAPPPPRQAQVDSGNEGTAPMDPGERQQASPEASQPDSAAGHTAGGNVDGATGQKIDGATVDDQAGAVDVEAEDVPPAGPDAGGAAPSATRPDHLSAAPDLSERDAAPAFVPLSVQLEGSESFPMGLEGSEPVVDGQLQLQPMMQQKEVRVRQMIRLQTHPNGTVTQEVLSEEVLEEGDEGYDDLGKEPTTISVETVTDSSARP